MDIEWSLTYCSLATLGEDAEEDLTMSTVDYRFIDADQHTYEPGDCFSRHMEAKFRNRTIEPGAPEPDGHRPFVLDGQRILPNFYDCIMGPGTWREALSLEGTQGFWSDEREFVRTAEHPEYRDGDARLAWMDAHNVEACILNCTIPPDLLWGSGDMELHYAHLRSFNRYLEEDWGFNYEGRIFVAGNMALDDLDMAVAELERLAKTGIRFLNFPPRPPLGGRPDDLPSEIFKRHISITPFYGDDIPRIMNLLGPDRLLLGTDWPHPEGVFEPSDFLDQLPGSSETEVRSFMRDNGARVFDLSASGGTG